MDETILDVRAASVRFGSVYALDDVSLTVARGEVLGVIGPNGAGKTTLFDVISGHRPPTSGTVVLDGQDVTRHSSLWRARHGVRRTFQRQQVFTALSVWDNVRTALDWRGGEGRFLADLVGWKPGRAVRAERDALVDEAIERCGLADARHQFAGTLPIGQARMLEVARAIVDQPRLLLLDEPTSGLGEVDTHRLGEVVQRFRRDTGCACLLVEHDVPFVMGQSDRVLVLHLGEVLAMGTPQEVQADDSVRAAYLGTPTQ
jgi:branched-chain amino acid transport system ATP-binding protein